MRAHWFAFAALFASGCTFSDGGPWAEVTASLDTHVVVPAGRDAGGGFQKLDTDYQVKLGKLELTASAVELRSGGGDVALNFNPAHPPAGYTLCHNGHCHRDDGALIDYADIAAELGGGGGPATVLVFSAPGKLDFLAGGSHALACEASCQLERGNLGAARLQASRLLLEGELRDGRTPARIATVPFRADLVLAPSTLAPIQAALDVAIDRDHDPDITLTLDAAASGALLDGIDVATLTADAGGVVDLGAPANMAAAARLQDNLSSIALTAKVSR